MTGPRHADLQQVLWNLLSNAIEFSPANAGGGTVHVASPGDGLGTTFTVRLPALDRAGTTEDLAGWLARTRRGRAAAREPAAT